MLKPVSLYLELFKYIWDPTSVWFKLNNPAQRKKYFSVALPLKMKVLSFEILGTTGLKPNHILKNLMAPWGGIHKGILLEAFCACFKCGTFCASPKRNNWIQCKTRNICQWLQSCRFYPVSWITNMRVSYSLSLAYGYLQKGREQGPNSLVGII